MFKKLKDKIAEEVKISPQRMQQLQQFTQSMTDKLQQGLEQGTISPDDGLFSISEDDSKTDSGLAASTSAPELPRRNSTSSVASDASFLPRYESMMNSYHLQSDPDVSASEVEDNLSQQSSSLGHVSKEQVHTAFQKAQMRYHKYRGRYTDLANHYRELERENAKMKAVLVETQDKAIRRVSELKEQCALGQRAKADLEAALRVEIEEKQIVVDSLKQKVGLLQGGGSEERVAELNDKLQEHKAHSIVAKEKLAALQRELDAEREEAAKSDAELRARLEHMKRDLDAMRVDLEAHEKGGGLKAQNANLIDKCDALKAKNHELTAELLKTARYELEIRDLRERQRELDALTTQLRDALQSKEAEVADLKSQLAEMKTRLAASESQLQAKDKEWRDATLASEETLEKLRQKHAEELRALQEETKQSLVALQDKIQCTLATEYREKEQQLKADFEVKLQQLNRDGDSFKQTQIKLMQAEDELRRLGASHGECAEALSALTERNVQLEKNYVQLLEESDGRQADVVGLRAQVKSLQGGVDGEQRKLRQLQEEKARLEADGRKAAAELTETVRRLRDEVEAKSGALTALELVAKDDEERRATMCDEMTALKENKRWLEGKLTEVNDNVDALSAAEKGLKGRLEEAHDELAAQIALADERGVAVARLEEQLAARTLECATAAEESGALRRDKVGLERHLRALDQDASKLQAKCAQLAQGLKDAVEGRDVDAETISVLRRDVVGKDEEIARLRATLETTTRDSEVITTQMGELTTKIDELERLQVKLVGVQDDYTKLRASHALLTATREALEAQLTEAATRWRTEKEGLIAQLEALSANCNHEHGDGYEEKCRELEGLRASRDEVDKRVAELQATVTLLQEKEDSLMRSQLAEKQTLIDQLNDVTGKYQEVFVQFETATRANGDVNRLLADKGEELSRERATRSDELAGVRCEVDSLTARNAELAADNKRLTDENDKLLAESADVVLQLATKIANTDAEVAAKLQDATAQRDDALAAAARANDELASVERRAADREAARAHHDRQVADLERHVGELEQERQLLRDEIDELKTAPVANVVGERDVEALRAQLARYKSIDQANRGSIEFYERELQKLRAKNDKLSRKLDETLVTLHHCADLSANTEVEYLRNVLYNYMLGKESVVLARVIAAVCKFDRQQTETVLKHEQHKQSLLGQLGIL